MLLLALGTALPATTLLIAASIPRPAQFFTQQLVDHFTAPSEPAETYAQRYYEISSHFGGAGSPIICIIGGEGAVPPSEGIFYPWVGGQLASRLGALVVQPEHRFYGERSAPPRSTKRSAPLD
jgi:hypothetical protein